MVHDNNSEEGMKTMRGLGNNIFYTMKLIN